MEQSNRKLAQIQYKSTNLQSHIDLICARHLWKNVHRLQEAQDLHFHLSNWKREMVLKDRSGDFGYNCIQLSFVDRKKKKCTVYSLNSMEISCMQETHRWSTMFAKMCSMQCTWLGLPFLLKLIVLMLQTWMNQTQWLELCYITPFIMIRCTLWLKIHQSCTEDMTWAIYKYLSGQLIEQVNHHIS